MRLKLDTMTGTGSAMTSTPLSEQIPPTTLPVIVWGTMSPYLSHTRTYVDVTNLSDASTLSGAYDGGECSEDGQRGRMICCSGLAAACNSSCCVGYSRWRQRFCIMRRPMVWVCLTNKLLLNVQVTYSVHLWLVGKRVVDFLLVLIHFFRQLSRLRRYKRILVQIFLFERGWVTLSANFRGKGDMHQWLLAPEN